MLQYRTRAGVLPNPCNCGLLEKLGLLDDFTLGTFPFCLKTHVANFQRCRCKAFSAPRPDSILFFATGGLRNPAFRLPKLLDIRYIFRYPLFGSRDMCCYFWRLRRLDSRAAIWRWTSDIGLF